MTAKELVKDCLASGHILSERMAYYILSGEKLPSFARAKVLKEVTGVSIEAWLDRTEYNPHVKGRNRK